MKMSFHTSTTSWCQILQISHKSPISPCMHSFTLNDIRESLLYRPKVPRQQSTSNTQLELLMSWTALHCSQLFIPLAESEGSSSDYEWMHVLSFFFSIIYRCCSIIWRWSSRPHNTLSCSCSHTRLLTLGVLTISGVYHATKARKL